MKNLIFLTLSFAIFAVCNGRMPSELSKILNMEEEYSKKPTIHLQEDLKKNPGTFLGTEFDNFLAKSASVENAGRELGSGEVKDYIAAPVKHVECHVVFQITERIPGRCTKLAGSIPACQSPKHIGINYNECN